MLPWTWNLTLYQKTRNQQLLDQNSSQIEKGWKFRVSFCVCKPVHIMLFRNLLKFGKRNEYISLGEFIFLMNEYIE